MWAFTGSRVTTYTAVKGTILGPWTTGEDIDTADGTPAGRAVMSASVLSDGRQDFGVFLRHCSSHMGTDA